MRVRFSPVMVIWAAAAAGLAYLGLRVEKAVNDAEPDPIQLQGTVVINEPAPVPAIEASTGAYRPLSENLLMMRRSDVRVQHGFIRLNSGIPVTLTQDKGHEVEVLFAGNRVTVPRSSVVSTAHEPAANPVDAMRDFIDQTLYAPASSIGIDAKEVGTGTGLDHKWESGHGSFDREFARTKSVEIEIRNLSRRPSGDCQLTVHWVARTLADRTRYVHYSESFKINVAGSAQQKLESACPPLDSRVEKYVMLDRKYVRGGKLDGWIVLLERDGKLLVGRGCNPVYDELLQDAGKRTELLATVGSATNAESRVRVD